MYSRRNPTPKTPPTAMCVELTGKPQLRRDDHGDCCRHGDTEGAHLVQFGDLAANGLDEFGPVKRQPERDTDRADGHDPKRDRGPTCNASSAHDGVIDRRQRTDRVRDIVCPVSEAQQRRRKDERDCKQIVDAGLVVFHACGLRLM